MAHLKVRPTKNSAERTILLKPGLNTIGRSANNDHIFPFPEIAQRHCEIVVEKNSIWVRDMESATGTYVDGKLIREAKLHPGQLLAIGEIEMILDTVELRLELPALHNPEAKVTPDKPTHYLEDGYAACQKHSRRHAVWKCTHCGIFHCNDCIKKLGRIGGVYLKFCPACGRECELSKWSEMVRARK